MIDVMVRIFNDVRTPTKSHVADAGLDLYAPETIMVDRGGSDVMDSCVGVTVPEGYCVVAYPRSSHNVGMGVYTTGLIDANYTGSIKLRLFNLGNEDVWIERGERFAQLVVQKVPKVRFLLDVGGTEEERGSDGFGSSGR